VKQKFRLYLRRCGPSCLMSFLLNWLFACQARRRRLFSRTSRSICRLVSKWLVCTYLPCGVEIVAASTSTSSRASVGQSMSASMLNWGVNLMCEFTCLLYFNQLVLLDVSLWEWSVVFSFEEELLALANGVARGPKALWRLLHCVECFLSPQRLLSLELSFRLLVSMWGY